MTPLRRFVRDLLEKMLGRYDEGPRLPMRFVEVAEEYYAQAAAGKGAREREFSRDVLAFAVGLASSAYRDGYARGFESSERWEKPWNRRPSPEEIADAEEPGWRSGYPFMPGEE